MANNTGKKFGGRTKGTPNKLTQEMKEKIKAVVEDSLSSIDLNECSNSERIRLIEIGLKYLLPALKQIENTNQTTFEGIDFKSVLKFE